MSNYFNSFLNRVYRYVVRNARLRTTKTREILDLDHNKKAIVERINFYNRVDELTRGEENLNTLMRNNLNEYEKAEWDLLKEYEKNSATAEGVEQRLEAIEVIKKLEYLSLTQNHLDPETVHYEILKAKTLLGEEGADTKLAEFIKERPHIKEYKGWVDPSEQAQIKLWPLH